MGELRLTTRNRKRSRKRTRNRKRSRKRKRNRKRKRKRKLRQERKKNPTGDQCHKPFTVVIYELHLKDLDQWNSML
jgi:hypothetical protein